MPTGNLIASVQPLKSNETTGLLFLILIFSETRNWPLTSTTPFNWGDTKLTALAGIEPSGILRFPQISRLLTIETSPMNLDVPTTSKFLPKLTLPNWTFKFLLILALPLTTVKSL